MRCNFSKEEIPCLAQVPLKFVLLVPNMCSTIRSSAARFHLTIGCRTYVKTRVPSAVACSNGQHQQFQFTLNRSENCRETETYNNIKQHTNMCIVILTY